MFSRIAVAGYMGSGKTTLARVIADKGMREICADREAKTLMEKDPDIKVKLIDEFGGDILEKEMISFNKLGLIVFNSLEQMKRLNAIVHPPLLKKLHSMLFSDDQRPVLLDAALIPLWNIEQWFDIRFWVYSTDEKRLSRLMQRAGDLTKDEIRSRMAVQQSMFEPPSPKTWRYIPNDNGLERFSETALECLGVC